MAKRTTGNSATGPLIGIYLLAEEHAQLSKDAQEAGFKSPALYLRALYRAHMQTPETVQRVIAFKAMENRMLDSASKLIADYLKTVTHEELLGALEKNP